MKLAFLGCGYVVNMYRLTMGMHPELELVAVADAERSRAENMARLTGARVCPPRRGQGQPFSIVAAYALLTMISFWPQMIGQLQYLFDKARKRGARLIEYKSAAACLETKPVREGSTHGRS